MLPVRRPPGPYAAAGLAAATAGVGAGHLVASLLAPEASPVVAIGATVIDLAPTGLKEWAVDTVGTADKPVLQASVVVVGLALGALAGLLHRRGKLGLWVVVGVMALAVVAALTRPASSVVYILPGVATGIVAALALIQLGGVLHAADAAAGAAKGVNRRTFVTGAALVGGAGLAAGLVGEWRLRPAGIVARPIAIPRAAQPLPPLPTGLEAATTGLSPLRTPTDDFYRIDTALVVPRVDTSEWRLRIDGEVDRPYEIGYADLLALPLIEADITLNCVSNTVGGDLVGSTRWTGVLVKDILNRAGVRSTADQVLSTSVDGMTISTPVEALLDDRGALLAVMMDGAPLPPSHGYPVRLVTPGLYGYVGATKWLTRLTATTYAARRAYWAERGWAERAEVQTQARIDVPDSGGGVSAGESTAVAGVAWSQAHGGISRVELQVDDGPWQVCRLGPDVGGRYWRQWRIDWIPTAGRHRLSVRATDGDGVVQTANVADDYPSGATGYHVIEVDAE